MSGKKLSEVWRDIRDFEDAYEVSTFGRVRNKRTGRILTPTTRNNNYLTVCLCVGNNRKQYLIHRLVGETFIENPMGLETIDHIDNNPTNNCLDNLRWLSQADNSNRRTKVVGASISYLTVRNSDYVCVSYLKDGRQVNHYFKDYDEAEQFYFEKCSDYDYVY